MNERGNDANKSYYRWTGSTPEMSHDYLDSAVFRALQDHFPKSALEDSRTRIFDAGCGNGALLTKLSYLGVTVAGCELSEEGVAIARSVLGPSIRVERMSLYDDLSSTFGPGWDIVISTEVVEHLYSPRQFVARINDLLAPNGLLIVSTPYHGYLKNLALAATGQLDGHFTALWDGGHIKFWSYRTLRDLLTEGGFGDFRFYGAGRLPGLWKSMIVSSRKI